MKRSILKDESITIEYICTEIFQGKQTDAEVVLIETLENLLSQAAYSNWTLTQLVEVLKKASISEEHASIFGKFWQSERDNIHKFLQSKQFNGHLERAAWRIDIQTATKRKDEMNRPVAIMELNLKKPDNSAKCVQFEMSRDELANLLTKFDKISSAIQKRS